MRFYQALDYEPTRSVLFRSAATLALRCGELREAEKLASIGLSGHPPDEIADELREVWDRAQFSRHLKATGIELGPEIVQLALAGRGVGYGEAGLDDVVLRAQATGRTYYRFAARKKGRKFEAHIDKTIQRDQPAFVSLRPNCVAISFRFGRQLSLPGTGQEEAVIDEMLECFELYENEDERSLRKLISDEAYYRNFIGLARQIAPDGEDVSMVGFTATRRGEDRTVALTKPENKLSVVGAQDVARLPAPIDETTEIINLTGELSFADSPKKGRRVPRDKIGITEQDGKRHVVIVPEGMMNDIVRPMWGFRVEAQCIKTAKGIYLDKIKPV
jgi:hypothetical protein